MKLHQKLVIGLLAAFVSTSSFAAIDGMDESVRPCIDRIKLSSGSNYVKPITEKELTKCYEGVKIHDKYLTKTLPEFAAWLGVRATIEKMDDELGKIVSLGTTKNSRIKKVPDNYDGIPVIRAYELMRSYEEDAQSADESYKNKQFVIVGTVNLIKKDSITGKTVVELEGDPLGLFNVYIYLDDQSIESAKHLNKDDIVSISGNIVGVSEELRMEIVDGKILDTFA